MSFIKKKKNIQLICWFHFIENNNNFVLINSYNVLDEDDIQGEEEGTSGMEGDVKVKYT